MNFNRRTLLALVAALPFVRRREPDVCRNGFHVVSDPNGDTLTKKHLGCVWQSSLRPGRRVGGYFGPGVRILTEHAGIDFGNGIGVG